MKREEKNQQTKRRIMDSALKEFAEQGYGASSVNHICNGEDISKGIIFHYFKTKDELYLACVEECFQMLTVYLKGTLVFDKETVRSRLQSYFDARLGFFHIYPLYQRMFCEAVIMPPRHLENAVRERKADFDALNIAVLNQILAPLNLRSGISRDYVVDLFTQFQAYINVRYRSEQNAEINFESHEEECRKALDVLLYGVAEKKEDEV